MNQQDQQAIEELFRYLNQAAAQAGPRDRDAEKLIERNVKHGSPGLIYQMAQTLVAQQHTINQLRSQLAAHQRQGGGAPAGFAAPPGAPGYQGYGQPQYQQAPYQQAQYQQGYQQYGRQGGGFLAGAGQLALGIGGGILGAEVLTSIFDGNLFGGGDREFEQGYQDGFAAGDDYDDRGQDSAADDAAYDNGAYDNGGDFGNDGGGFDDGGGIF